MSPSVLWCPFSILKKSMINVTSLDPDAASPTRGSLREEPEAWEPDVLESNTEL